MTSEHDVQKLAVWKKIKKEEKKERARPQLVSSCRERFSGGIGLSLF